MRRADFATAVLSHVLGAQLAMVVAMAFDLATMLNGRAREVESSALSLIAGVFHLYALSFPVVLALGLVTLIASLTLRDAPVLAFFDLRRAHRPAPTVVGGTLAAIAAGLAFVAGTTAAALFVTRRLHDPTLIAAATGGLVLPLALALRPFHTHLARVLERLVTPLDFAGSPLVFLALAFEVALVLRARLDVVAPAFSRSVPWPNVYSLGVLLLGTLVACVSLHRPRFVGAVRILGGFALLAGVGSFGMSAITYGATSSHRFLVEDVSFLGARAHRIVSELLDRDGDGLPALLGGGDCDDHRRDVHPGALDRPGDGVDADCFGGDGTPPFDDRNSGGLALGHEGARRPHLLFISVDTMRPDRLRALGSRRAVAPSLDRFATSATLFRDVTAAAPRTTRSIPAVFTGQYPGRIRYERTLGHLDVSGGEEMLAERLVGVYATGAILGTAYFRSMHNMLQGFVSVDEPVPMKAPAAWVTERAIPWIDRMATAEQPHFLWLHYFNPHEPYLGDRAPSQFGGGPIGAYDTEVHRADEEVGKVLDRVAARGLLDKTVIVVFSDHGESLGERGFMGHSTRLDQEQIASVLMIRAPGIAPSIVDHPVALFDIYATALDFAGMQPSQGISSRSLVPAMQGNVENLVRRPLFSEILPDAVYAIETQMVRMGREKLVYYPTTGRTRLFDLGLDPAERHDLSDERPASRSSLLSVLHRWNVFAHLPENRVAALIADATLDALPPGATRLDARFANGIRLVGASTATARASSDSTFEIDLFFRAEQPITVPYMLHLTFETDVGAPRTILLTAHHTAADGCLPTTQFRPGTIIRDRVIVRMPSTLTPNSQLFARLEIWSHYHNRTPVTVVQDGTPRDYAEVAAIPVD